MEFNLPNVHIFDTNHGGDALRTAFKRRKKLQDMLCRRDYAERVVASFAHKIQSEYYGGNRYLSIEGIEFKNFSALPQTEIKSSTEVCPRHEVFYYVFVR